ncbi:uncharacterized protein LOC144407945 isoform X2 [Gasterosteus aculeatus]
MGGGVLPPPPPGWSPRAAGGGACGGCQDEGRRPRAPLLAGRGVRPWRYDDSQQLLLAANSGRCSNLTLVLDNWKYAIVTRVRDLLLRDHSAVLPDYARIQPLSDALRDLYKDFNGLKERLSQFTARFDRVERFVDGVRYGRNPPPLRGRPGEAEPPGRRTRVVVRRVKKPAGPEK